MKYKEITLRIKEIARKFWHVPFMKYALAIVLGVLIVGFVGENSIWAHFRNLRRISELNTEIDDYNSRHQRDQSQLRRLEANPKAMEKIARERYFMKADDEDIFVLSDDDRHTNTLLPDSTHETAE
jgi:cell division protein FtsB